MNNIIPLSPEQKTPYNQPIAKPIAVRPGRILKPPSPSAVDPRQALDLIQSSIKFPRTESPSPAEAMFRSFDIQSDETGRNRAQKRVFSSESAPQQEPNERGIVKQKMETPAQTPPMNSSPYYFGPSPTSSTPSPNSWTSFSSRTPSVFTPMEAIEEGIPLDQELEECEMTDAPWLNSTDTPSHSGEFFPEDGARSR